MNFLTVSGVAATRVSLLRFSRGMEIIISISVVFKDIESLLNVVDRITTSNIFPAAIDFMDKNSIMTSDAYSSTGIDTDIEYLLLVKFDGDRKSLDYQSEKAKIIMKSSNNLFFDLIDKENKIQQIWNARRVSYAATTRLAPDVISDDLIVPRDKVADLVHYCNDITEKFDLKMCMVGHIGDGNLHPQIAVDLSNEIEYRNYIDAKSKIYEKVVELGGSISAEHGVGLDKLNYLEQILDENTIDYMKMIKKVFDPNNILNPGKIFK